MSQWPEQHPDISQKTGILLVNLGTPSAPSTGAVRRYLREFLSDRRVVDLPSWLWKPLLNLIILPIRSPRSAKAYREIWEEKGSPLLLYSQALREGVADRLPDCQVELAMRYGEPPVEQAMQSFEDARVERVLVLPLYPQYSRSTTASVFDAVAASLADRYWMPELHLVRDYFKQAAWSSAVAQRIRDFQRKHGQPDHLLFSLHGLPESFLQRGDPYFCQCHASVRAISGQLELKESDYSLAFQSRVGRQQWLKPYTEEQLTALARNGHRHVQVVCPGFAVDCLETLEEIAIRGAETFVEAGGERLEYIPALNADEQHVDVLLGVIRQQLGAWVGRHGFEPDLADSVLQAYPDYPLGKLR